jgi:hypothetical protein
MSLDGEMPRQMSVNLRYGCHQTEGVLMPLELVVQLADADAALSNRRLVLSALRLMVKLTRASLRNRHARQATGGRP